MKNSQPVTVLSRFLGGRKNTTARILQEILYETC